MRHRSPISPSPAGFTLLEMLVAMAVTVLLVALIGRMVSESLLTIGATVKLLDAHGGAAGALKLLRDDLDGLSPIPSSGSFYAEQTEDRVLLAVARIAPRIPSATAHGIARHVVYEWTKETGRFTRAEYHSARDDEAVGQTASSGSGEAHEANRRRLETITPLLSAARPFAWIEDERLRRARDLAREVPALQEVHSLEVECFAEWPGTPEKSWGDPRKLPELVRIRIRFKPGPRGGQGRTIELLLPVSPKL